jgi:hypothetical protein
MRSLVDSAPIDELNAELRRRNPRGFTQGQGMRHVANIDIDEYALLLAAKDKDALAFELSGRTDRAAFRRLLARFPEWRASEGGV